MKRSLYAAVALTVMSASSALAAPTLEEIVDQLKAQGYASISVSRTWLGRVRIEAESDTHEREIVFNQRTGEILRDFWEELDEEDEEDDDEGEDPEDSEDEVDENADESDEDDAEDEEDSGDDDAEADDEDDGDDEDGGDEDDEDD